MSLPMVSQQSLDVRPINWLGLPKRFMNPGELEVLVALVKSVAPPARIMIEIGVNEGRTARSIIREVQSIECYVGVDVEHGYRPIKRFQVDEIPDIPGKYVRGDPLFHLVLRRRGSLDLNPEDLPQCDVMFIDGDHGREAVFNDTRLAQGLVRTGGLIVWHDYHDAGTVDVPEVLDFLHRAGMEIEHIEGTWLAVHKVQ